MISGAGSEWNFGPLGGKGRTYSKRLSRVTLPDESICHKLYRKTKMGGSWSSEAQTFSFQSKTWFSQNVHARKVRKCHSKIRQALVFHVKRFSSVQKYFKVFNLAEKKVSILASNLEDFLCSYYFSHFHHQNETKPNCPVFLCSSSWNFTLKNHFL